MHPAALICPNDTRGKAPWSFSPRGSPFSLRNHRRTQRKTQRMQSPQDAKNARNAIRSDKGRSAKRRTKRTPKARTLSKKTAFILPIPPKWVPPVDRMIFISPTCILTGREALAGREGRAGWVDRKKDAKNCMFKNAQNKVQRL